MPWGWIFAEIIGDRGSTKVAIIMVVQVCFPMHLYGKKTFKNLILHNRGCLMAESLHILLGTSACLQWLCHSGERTVARGTLVFILFYHDEQIIGKLGNVVPCKYVSASSMDPNFIGKVISFLQIFLPALSIGPLFPQVFCQCEEFSLSLSIWADIWKYSMMKMIKRLFLNVPTPKKKSKC